MYLKFSEKVRFHPDLFWGFGGRGLQIGDEWVWVGGLWETSGGKWKIARRGMRRKFCLTKFRFSHIIKMQRLLRGKKAVVPTG